MNKCRIYLSVSKQCNIESLRKIRDFFKNYNVELLEFEGGEYTTDMLLSADLVLFLPAELSKSFTYDFYLAKGQTTEYNVSALHDRLIKFIICAGETIFISSYEDHTVHDYDWKKRYAWFNCKEELTDIDELLNEYKISNKTNSFKLHLAVCKI